MVIYDQDVRVSPDVSERLLRPLSDDDANFLLADPELQAESKRTGIDLALLIKNWKLEPSERWRTNRRQALALARWDQNARQAGLKR
ncbi:MAG: hypothetical protein HY291_19300 [Planctomycetes bacterium]|nr:hypothetical protein [Planctomycetota bacterium]